ncbi:Eco57I restriction-modification methylase domain-containing protein [Flavobacteriaceae bacterium]|nr:Eco57I restriction-modification methylase domain-containing protein [Flavobacteriaceae bacterium]
MLNQVYNPDVLTCIANLSSDEVFTPPSVVNQMLDTLPKELWSDEKVTFLDPVSKSGVFLREITKRLIDGLDRKIPNLEERIEHILRNQVFGIGITELTSLISRRSLYCSKYANGKYSIVQFDDEQGNLKYFETEHTWEGKSCKYCGVSKEIYDRGEELESYSYSFIHSENPKIFFNMKFDVIIGNPPYQMDDGGSGASAKPLYNKFIESSKKLNPRFISMIIPSRWFAGGKGLNDFRDDMLNDKRLKYINDYVNSKECFPGVSLGGGVNYFLWDKNYFGDCEVVNSKDGTQTTDFRPLNEFEIFVRSNTGVNIIRKVKKQNFVSIENFISTRNPFGFVTKDRGSKEKEGRSFTLHSSKGVGYVSLDEISKNRELTRKYKIMISSRTSEHAGVPDKTGRYRVLSSSKVLPPFHVCTDSYIIIGPFDNIEKTENFLSYLRTKFVRYLLSLATTGIQFTVEKFRFIPQLENYDVTDEFLYNKFELSESEIKEIEKTIKEY